MTSVVVAAGAALSAVAVSPLLASWTAVLVDGPHSWWWRPRRTSFHRWAVVTAAAVLLTVAATQGRPLTAWWLLAAGGAVLAVVDTERHLLPARFTYPLFAAVLIVLAVTAAVAGSARPLLRAILAMLGVGGIWFAAAFASPSGIHLGDVRLAALTATTLGWLGWNQVPLGQALTAALALVTAAIVAAGRPQLRSRGMPVPMGPAMITAAVLACWL